jgi:cell division protein YceG involved in septum cleavage
LEEGRLNNAERILTLLTDMRSDINDLKAGQAKLETRLSGLEADVDSIRSSVTRIEVVHGRKLDALFDGYQQLNRKAEHIDEQVTLQVDATLNRMFATARAD